MSNGNPANSCHFVGRIITEPQFQTLNGSSGPFTKATFTMAVDRNNITPQQRQAARNGDTSVVTSDFIRCAVIGAGADFVKNYCPKGKAVNILARYTSYKYTDKNTGQEQYGHQFDIDSIGFVTQDAKSLQQNAGVQQPTYAQATTVNNGGYAQNQQSYAQPQNNYGQQQPQLQQPAPNFMNPPQSPQGGFDLFDNGGVNNIGNSPF